MTYHYQDLINIFNQCFSEKYNTRLVKGLDEPIYSPANSKCAYHQIVFAHGYYASAVHEIAHWCVAGEKRRLLEDYGYWYEPDGRDLAQQEEFERVEVKPQAIEWILSRSAGFKFGVSSDNLHADLRERDSTPFKDAVHKKVQFLLVNGLDERVKILSDELIRFYSQSALNKADFLLDEL
jgi:elongation factor P hydroxylase